MFLLTKRFSLIRPEYEQLLQEVFQFPVIERQYTEINEQIFKLKYISKYHPEDIDRLAETYTAASDTNALASRNWGEFLTHMFRMVIESNPGTGFDPVDIEDFYSSNIVMSSQTIDFTVHIISANRDLLKYLDEIIPNDFGRLKLYKDHFYRYKSVSYNDAIESYFPEKFEVVDDEDSRRIGKDDRAVFVHNFTFQTSENCNLNCFTGETPILMADFTYRPIWDINPGDMIMGFEEEVTEGQSRTLVPMPVTKVFSRTAECCQLSSDSAQLIGVTREHPFLNSTGEWIPAGKISPTDGIMITSFDIDDHLDIDISDTCYMKGYFLACFMAAGFLSEDDRIEVPRSIAAISFISFGATETDLVARLVACCRAIGFTPRVSTAGVIDGSSGIGSYTTCSLSRDEYQLWTEVYSELTMVATHDNAFLMGFAAGMFDVTGTIDTGNVIVLSGDMTVLSVVGKAMDLLGINYMVKPATTGEYSLRTLGGYHWLVRFIGSVQPAVWSKGMAALVGEPAFTYQTGVNVKPEAGSREVYNLETFGHTFIAAGFLVHNCTYCYQGNKTASKMTLATGKVFVDKLLAGEYGYINDRNSPALIIEFIGGDPFLEIPLSRKIYEYFLERTYQLRHPWFEFHRMSICSNGLLYFDKEVQEFFSDFAHKISFNISIDGNKELHDACRIQPNGEGSYDVDMAALRHYSDHHASDKNSKMTLAPSNIKYLFESVTDFISQGMGVINLNCIFEEGWGVETALLEYNELKHLADYLLEHDLEHLFIAIFSDLPDERWSRSFDGNFCGGTGAMLSMGPDGAFYPCLRYMPSSIGDDCPQVTIGNVHTGMIGREQGSEILGIFSRITRRSQSTDVCYNCPIGSGCAWCSANCHQVNGTADRRTTFHCIQTIAEALANVYYWNLLNIKQPAYNLGVRKNNVPDQWALKIISEAELDYLKAIENRSAIATMEHVAAMDADRRGG